MKKKGKFKVIVNDIEEPYILRAMYPSNIALKYFKRYATENELRFKVQNIKTLQTYIYNGKKIPLEEEEIIILPNGMTFKRKFLISVYREK